MTSQKMSEIQVWHTFDPVEINDDVLNNDLIIEHHHPKNLPLYLEEDVEMNWKEASAKKQLTDNQILYITSPPNLENGKIIINADARGFRYTQAFNRNPAFYGRTEELNRYKLLSISNHCHLKTNDDVLIFGTKKNQFNQISGFSGFPNIKEDGFEADGKNYLDIYATIRNRLEPEIGSLVDNIKSIMAVGITYVDNPVLRGVDMDYLLELNVTAANAQKQFEESAQFKRRLHIVEFKPHKIAEFLEQNYREGKQMSPYALGCIYAETKAMHGQKDADLILNTIKKLDISISTTNETAYFNQ